MIISSTPFRISFFGGGTDYPAWYREHGGAVLGTTINKHCYITCRYLPPFFDHKYRVVYSKIENCQSVDEIAHAAVREILRYLQVDQGVEIHHDGDLPARSGVGSSSSFTVGLLHAVSALKGKICSKEDLAGQAIHIEQEVLHETVGSQDQVLAAYGGLNHIEFLAGGGIQVKPLTLHPERMADLNAHLMLFFTGINRTASSIARSYVEDMDGRERQLRNMHDMVQQAIAILSGGGEIAPFGRLLHEAWQAKRSLSDKVSNPVIEEIYEQARAAGALGGKLTGAGGGGFMLLFVPPAAQRRVRDRLRNLIHVPFRFDFSGSRIIFFDPGEDYSAQARVRAAQSIPRFHDATRDV
jgi:D-glycero-alpha-D-manno-heptose-7-phosphate kinase